MRRLALLVACAVAACGRVGVPALDLPGRGAGHRATADMVENRVWLEAGGGVPPGSFVAFVGDGTAIAGSCDGPARFGAWRWVEDATLAWEDAGDTARFEVGLVGPRELVLVPQPAGDAASRAFRAAQTPTDCPG